MKEDKKNKEEDMEKTVERQYITVTEASKIPVTQQVNDDKGYLYLFEDKLR